MPASKPITMLFGLFGCAMSVLAILESDANALLGVARGTSATETQRAYRHQSLRDHPARQPTGSAAARNQALGQPRSGTGSESAVLPALTDRSAVHQGRPGAPLRNPAPGAARIRRAGNTQENPGRVQALQAPVNRHRPSPTQQQSDRPGQQGGRSAVALSKPGKRINLDVDPASYQRAHPQAQQHVTAASSGRLIAVRSRGQRFGNPLFRDSFGTRIQA